MWKFEVALGNHSPALDFIGQMQRSVVISGSGTFALAMFFYGLPFLHDASNKVQVWSTIGLHCVNIILVSMFSCQSCIFGQKYLSVQCNILCLVYSVA